MGLKKWIVLSGQNYKMLGQKGWFELQLPFNSRKFSKTYFCWHLDVITWPWHKFLAINTYQLFYYNFPKFLAKGVLSTTTIFEKISNNWFQIFPIFFFVQEQSFWNLATFCLREGWQGFLELNGLFHEVGAVGIILQLSIGFCIFLWWPTSLLIW